MRGIISYGAYVPYNRLKRLAISEAMGGAPQGGTRSVASYDEDTTTMGVEAGRLAMADTPDGVSIDSVWFSTAEPAYLEKTNATTIHAALRLDTDVAAVDFGGAARSGIGALKAALTGGGTTLAVTSGIRTGLPTGADESGGGDGAVALLVADESVGPVLAEYLGGTSVSAEFLDRWRQPGDAQTKFWAERYTEGEYLGLADEAWNGALKSTELAPDAIDKVIVTGVHPRAARSLGRRLGVDKDVLVDDLSRTVGNTGAAHPALVLSSVLDAASPGQTIAIVNLADGADVIILRTTDAIGSYTPTYPVAEQIAVGNDDLPYAKFLTWRGMLVTEPPRRPEPDRVSGSAAGRSRDWKFGFVATRDRASGAVHMPPARVSMKGGSIDDMDPAPMADVPATIVTLTVDRVSYSPSPPIVAAIVDFDGGGRMPTELTDCAADELAIGDRIEMTFRLRHSSDGIHNYFWKARPIRGGSTGSEEG